MSETTVVHVEPGETLSEIAARHGVTVEQLQEWNRIKEADYVQAGQRIVVHDAVVTPGWNEAAVAWSGWLGAALVVVALLLLFRRKRRTPTSAPDTRVSSPTEALHRHGSKPTPVLRTSAPKANAGERRVQKVLTRRYRDWPLLNNVLLRSGGGTAQIDHILISPAGVFVIETKDMGGWIFASPGQQRWTQTFRAGRWSRMMGIKSKRFPFYNPLLQNEGHAKALVKLGVVKPWEFRPVVVFVGDAELKTEEKFVRFEEHEEKAKRFRGWRMRGVVCMSLTELHRYIDFSVRVTSSRSLTRERMEAIRAKIATAALPVTAETHAKHVEYARSAKRASW
ncbi:MAG: LysM peptidoglycan-binding domain-containing protein [Gammaproteobacteria bacterium]|nr:LysM peptidoglycan-binding domain-containing protein [Gammaproteobacteria bacterium]MYF66239.1 LysM peptidoglycan-binding domain-containing protein [Gammaproteobacteria bacterium]MYK38246.1 LysM peptidoglycan-binding domain-containing protein [Gammaproteobacteria bacterium]